jgi:hypothetical protein
VERVNAKRFAAAGRKLFSRHIFLSLAVPRYLAGKICRRPLSFVFNSVSPDAEVSSACLAAVSYRLAKSLLLRLFFPD